MRFIAVVLMLFAVLSRYSLGQDFISNVPSWTQDLVGQAYDESGLSIPLLIGYNGPDDRFPDALSFWDPDQHRYVKCRLDIKKVAARMHIPCDSTSPCPPDDKYTALKNAAKNICEHEQRHCTGQAGNLDTDPYGCKDLDDEAHKKLEDLCNDIMLTCDCPGALTCPLCDYYFSDYNIAMENYSDFSECCTGMEGVNTDPPSQCDCCVW